MLSFSPPRFRTMKKGPRAGESVEEKFLAAILHIATLTDHHGITYRRVRRISKSSVSLSKIHVSTGVSISATAARETIVRRWHASAAELISFLLMEE